MSIFIPTVLASIIYLQAQLLQRIRGWTALVLARMLQAHPTGDSQSKAKLAQTAAAKVVWARALACTDDGRDAAQELLLQIAPSASGVLLAQVVCTLSENEFARGSDASLNQGRSYFKRVLLGPSDPKLSLSLQRTVARRWVMLEARFGDTAHTETALQLMHKLEEALGVPEEDSELPRLRLLQHLSCLDSESELTRLRELLGVVSSSSSPPLLYYEACCATELESLGLVPTHIDDTKHTPTSIGLAMQSVHRLTDAVLANHSANAASERSVDIDSSVSAEDYNELDLAEMKLVQAELYQRIGAHHLAATAATSAVMLDPTSARARLLLARANYSVAACSSSREEAKTRVRAVEKQLQIYQQLVKSGFSKGDPRAQTLLLHCNALLARSLDAGVEMHPGVSQWLATRALPVTSVQHKMQCYEKFLETHDETDNPAFPEALQELAILQLRAGDVQSAEKTLMSASRCDKDSLAPVVRLALLNAFAASASDVGVHPVAMHM